MQDQYAFLRDEWIECAGQILHNRGIFSFEEESIGELEIRPRSTHSGSLIIKNYYEYFDGDRSFGFGRPEDLVDILVQHFEEKYSDKKHEGDEIDIVREVSMAIDRIFSIRY